MPKTIENCRVIDETFIKDIQNDPELQLDLNTDEISRHFKRRKAQEQEEEDLKKVIKNENSSDDGIEEDEELDEKYRFVNAPNDEEEFNKKRKELKYKNDENDESEAFTDSDDEDDDNDVEEESNDPKILITTTNMKIRLKTYKLCRELSRILPNAQYFYRKNVRISKVIPEAIKRDYSALIVINESRKEPGI